MIDFLTNHWDAIAATLAAVILLADKVTKLTSTTRDDEIVAKIEDVVGKLLPKVESNQ